MSKRVKRVKKTKKNKKIKGGLSRVKFDTMYGELQVFVQKSIHLTAILDKNEEEEIPLASKNDWCALIARLYFDDKISVLFSDSPLGEKLSKDIDYNNEKALRKYLGEEDIPKDNFDTMYGELQEFVQKTIHLKDITKYILDKNKEYGTPIPYLVLSESDWGALIARLFDDKIFVLFDDSELGKVLSVLIDYESETSLDKYKGNVFDEDEFPRRRTLSVSQSYQGPEGTCFAHAASLLIFHNIYQLPLTEEDKKLYLKNNCNLHLDTTTELEDFGRLRMRCGDGGAIRILLFTYIYKVITKQFGCDGNTIISILYYLKTPFQKIFTSELNALLLPIFESAPKDFSVSSIPMNEFKTYDYKSFLHEVLKKYYVGLRIKSEDSHAVAIVDINEDGVIGKDSAYGDIFFIPFEEFNSKSPFRGEKGLSLIHI